MEYCKINTLFLRDDNNIIIPSRFTCEEFEYLKDNLWEATEKIDGTNMRVELTLDTYDVETMPGSFEEETTISMNFRGRTDNAQIPPHLLDKMKLLFDKDTLIEYFFKDKEPCSITLFGEGYGAKIQKGGNYIKDDVNFILFDVLVNGKWWLKRSALEQIAKDLNIEIVPLIGYMTIPEAIEYVKKGFKSTIAENKEYNAEGLVLKPTCGLLDRSGKRIITKIKTCDFQKFAAKYGADYTGEQPVNNKYKV